MSLPVTRIPPAPSTGRPKGDAGAHAFAPDAGPARDLLDACVHCGFCLPTCPTYVLWGEEMDSPRGRILLMDLADKGEIGLDATAVRHWDSCLGCMACVTSCPSGVRYDLLIEATRAQIEERFAREPAERRVRDAAFAVLPHHRRMTAVTAPLIAFRASGLQRALRRSRLYGRLPARLRRVEALAPIVTWAGVREAAPALSRPAGAPVLRVAMLTGCVQRAVFGDVNAATARVLAAHGCEVRAPRAQACCGALELHAGRAPSARERARRLIADLDAPDVDRIVVNSAGCGSTLKEYGHLLADDPAWAERAAAFAAKVRDLHEVLAELEPPAGALRPLPMRLAYHDACHLAHAQGVRAEPRAVLARIPGLELVEIPDAAICCGSAGVYNLLQPEPAAELGRLKAGNVRRAAPDALAAANPGCLIQISASLGGDGDPVPTFHPVELVDASLRGEDAAALLARRTALLASAGAAP
ncbi:MAG: 4Fe-4S dicluster domain-containing protein [Actinobacteria bacterium]|nr:4Fe-4S dicluster domain-containing protein [Actinomycetota bacterium]